MKSEKGMSLIAVFFIIILIIVLSFVTYNFAIKTLEKQKIENIKANMLIIQGKCKVLQENTKVNKNTDSLKGKKLSDMLEDDIILDFSNKGIIEEEKVDKYYVLSDNDLIDMGLDIKNEENSFYIVNYEENIVYITKGYLNFETNEVIYKIED